MPIFEFECLSCHKEFEELVLGAQSGIQCPACQSDQVKKLMSVVAFKSDGQFVSTSASDGCSGCASHSCSSCR